MHKGPRFAAAPDAFTQESSAVFAAATSLVTAHSAGLVALLTGLTTAAAGSATLLAGATALLALLLPAGVIVHATLLGLATGSALLALLALSLRVSWVPVLVIHDRSPTARQPSGGLRI
jgi:hypothetical protein